MKRKGFMSIFLILFSLFAFGGSLFKNNQLTLVSAEEDIIEIGKLYFVDRVTEQTRVYIESSNVSFIESTGRTVYSEIVTGGTIGDPIIPYVSIKPVTIKYYYYATPEQGIYKYSCTMRNDFDSLVNAVLYLEEAAEDYGYTTRSSIINHVFEYIRSTNASYANDSFDKIAGHYNDVRSFISYIDEANHGGLKICEYFASFLSSSSYNTDSHGAVGSIYSSNHFLLDNPYAENKDLDLVHLITVIDGVFNDTGTSDLVTPVADKYVINAIMSWGGDLQTATSEFRNSIDSTFDIEEMFFDPEEGSSKFEFSDLYSDIIGYNIATSLNNSTNSLSQVISNYINTSLTNETNIYDEFIHNVVSDYRPNETFSSINFKKCVYELMALNYVSETNITYIGMNTIENRFKCCLLDVMPSYEKLSFILFGTPELDPPSENVLKEVAKNLHHIFLN
ncbi:MAG: hypothetical protein ACI31G_03625 [Bacilli bacterium]